MSRCGDVYENKVTGEYAVVLRGTEDRGNGPGIVHLVARPRAAVIGEHYHPYIRERFTVVKGKLEIRIGGRLGSLGPGQSACAEAGAPHDWWNASSVDDAHVLIEIERAVGAECFDLGRFELLIGTLFGLANDGRVNSKGRPNPLQAAVIAREFQDVIVFTRPPLLVQRLAIGILAAIGYRLGYLATYPEYGQPHGHREPDPEAMIAARLL
jgi:quercetin dioxygenase-like cupin family protein